MYIIKLDDGEYERDALNAADIAKRCVEFHELSPVVEYIFNTETEEEENQEVVDAFEKALNREISGWVQEMKRDKTWNDYIGW